MIKHPTRIITAIFAVASIIVAVGIGLGISSRHRGTAMFAEVRSITFIQDALSGHMKPLSSDIVAGLFARKGPERMKLVVTNWTDVRRFVSAIQLDKKATCWCLHMHRAVFETPAKSIEVSFCAGCFDLVEPGGARNYKMPAAFYSELLKQIKAKGQDGWLLSKP